MKSTVSLGALAIALVVTFPLISLGQVAPAATQTQPTTAEQAAMKIALQKIIVEPLRNKRTKLSGGDWDDKTDRITFTVKMTNPDPKIAISGLKAEFYVFSQGVVDRKVYQLLGRDESDVNLGPRATHSFVTGEVVTMYDTTEARFGTRYDSWAFLLRDSAGNIVYKKSPSPYWLPNAHKLNTLTVGSAFDKDLKPFKRPTVYR